MADFFNKLSLIAFLLSGICLLLMIYFWFKFRVPALISDLSGRTAKKSIERMREKYEEEGKSRRAGAVRAKLKTEKIYNASGQTAAPQAMTDFHPETTLIGEDVPAQTALLNEGGGHTEPLAVQPFKADFPSAPAPKAARLTLADYEFMTDIVLTDQDDFIPISVK